MGGAQITHFVCIIMPELQAFRIVVEIPFKRNQDSENPSARSVFAISMSACRSLAHGLPYQSTGGHLPMYSQCKDQTTTLQISFSVFSATRSAKTPNTSCFILFVEPRANRLWILYASNDRVLLLPTPKHWHPISMQRDRYSFRTPIVSAPHGVRHNPFVPTFQ